MLILSFCILQQALQDIHPLYVALFSYLITWKEKQIRKLFDPEVRYLVYIHFLRKRYYKEYDEKEYQYQM